MRKFAGKILIRIPPELHSDLAQEAFASGRSINQLCLEAIMARKALKNFDPWRQVEAIWRQNRKFSPRRVQADILRAIAEVRRDR